MLVGAQWQCGDTTSIAPLIHPGSHAWSCMAPCRPTMIDLGHLLHEAQAGVGDEMSCCVASS